MPEVKYAVEQARSPFLAEPKSRLKAEGSVWGAAIRQESDVYNWWSLLSAPAYKPDIDFDLTSTLKPTPYWDTHRDRFLGVTSKEAFDAKVAQIEQERRDREVLRGAGAAGIAAQMAVGLASPTVFIPAVGSLRYGVKAASLSGAALGAVAGGLQELPLQLAQEERSEAEAVAAVGMGAVLGGLVGGYLGKRATSTLSNSLLNETRTESVLRADLLGGGERVDMVAPHPFHFTYTTGKPGALRDVTVNADRVVIVSKKSLPLLEGEYGVRGVSEVVNKLRDAGFDGVYIHPTLNGKRTEQNLVLFDEGLRKAEPNAGEVWGFPEMGDGVFRHNPEVGGESVGAAAVKAPSAGRTKRTVIGTQPIEKIIEKSNPVLRTINQKTSKVAREMMSMLSDAGVKFEGNVKFIPLAKGGTVESRIGQYDVFLARGVEELRKRYTEHIYGAGQARKVFTKTALVGHLTSGRLSYAEFKKLVSRAIREGGESDIPEVKKAAQFVMREVYDQVLSRAQEVGLVPEKLRKIADAGYLNRVYDRAAIELNPTRFVDILASHFEQLLAARFQAAREKLLKAESDVAQFVHDVKLPEDEVKAAQEELQNVLEVIDGITEQVEEEGAKAAAEQAKAAAANPSLPEAVRRDLREAAKEMARTQGSPLRILKSIKRQARKRLRNLSKAQVVLAEKQRTLWDRADRLEELSLEGLRRAARAGKRELTRLDKTETKIGEVVTRARNAFASAVNRFDRAEERLSKLGDSDPAAKADLELKRLQAMERVNAVLNKLDSAETLHLNRDEIKGLIQEGLDATLERINEVNLRRARRADKLRERAKELDPKTVKEAIVREKERLADKRLATLERMRVLGADDVDLAKGIADFSRKAREDAEGIKAHILQTDSDLPNLELMLGARGPEITRGLASLRSNAVEEFLVNDTEELLHRYINAFGPDVELTRALGSVNGEEHFIRLAEEQNAIERELQVRFDKAGSQAERKAIEKEKQEVAATFDDARKSLRAVINRLRHRRGMPTNPDGIAARAGYAAMGINTLRMMGMVTVSSLPDIARPLFRFGVGRAFKDAFLPLISDWKRLNLSRRELRLAGAAVELVTHNRVHQLTDIMGRMPLHATKFERAVEWGSSRMGLVALYDYWTNFMKELHGTAAIAQFLDDVDLVINGGGKAKEIEQATERLAAGGIDVDLAARIWALTTDGKGGNKVKGTWLPNTAEWEDREAAEAFHAAIRREVNIGIVTPGVDKPLFADANLAMKLVMQFKSFAMASMTRTLMAGLQDGPARFVFSSLASMALGALSYFIWAEAVGGRAQKEMRQAGWGKWMDEAIDRSGVTASFGEGQRILSQFPGLNDKNSWLRVTFSGRPATRRASGPDILKYLLGPTGGLVSTASSVLANAQHPTQSTAHQARSLLPYNQVFWWRRIITALEKSISKTAGLPKSRRAK